MRLINRIGDRYGKLVVIGRADRAGVYWECACDCGGRSVVNSHNLKKGHTVSCGCYRSEWARQRKTIHSHATHDAHSPTYVSWASMKRRCNNKNHDGYDLYGGRGISVCPAWESFEGFLADMGERPSGTSIDRIDPNGNYEPQNCRWATSKQQQNNRRNNRARRG